MMKTNNCNERKTEEESERYKRETKKMMNDVDFVALIKRSGLEGSLIEQCRNNPEFVDLLRRSESMQEINNNNTDYLLRHTRTINKRLETVLNEQFSKNTVARKNALVLFSIAHEEIEKAVKLERDKLEEQMRDISKNTLSLEQKIKLYEKDVKTKRIDELTPEDIELLTDIGDDILRCTIDLSFEIIGKLSILEYLKKEGKD